jgi:hypothetical protein
LRKEENLHTYKSTERDFLRAESGFLTVEAAIFLPLFIIGVLTFAYLIKFMAVQEGIFHSFTDEARILCAESSFNPLEAPLFEPKLADRIYDENGDAVSDVDVEHFLYLYPSRGMTGLISMDLNYDVKIKLPIPFYEKLPVSESLLFRGFIGKEEHNGPLPFSEMEKEKKSELVWVFPRAGGKYHGENCTYISSEPKQMVMSAQIRRKYSRCSICNSETLQDGRLVYCFKTGSSYHTGDCPIVDKYVISIEKEKAIKDGYTACSKCGGI